MEAGGSMSEIKGEVRQFYDQVGWQLIGEELYQNSRYEDLRPVSRQYIHDCHMRVARHLPPSGRYFLDAGSGPVQYPEYLEYSRGYTRRVCADISITALRQARRRIGDHGLFVVADVANLPFASQAFQGIVSLHTLHHLPEGEQVHAYHEFYRVLAGRGSGVVVNGWSHSALLATFEPLVRLANRARHWIDRKKDNPPAPAKKSKKAMKGTLSESPMEEDTLKGTFTNRYDPDWIRRQLGNCMPVQIFVWRSVSVRFLRALIHPRLGGRLWLRLLYSVEERFPHFFGEVGKYPLIVIRKPQEDAPCP
jgi:SAM-dependent methyltransferase